ncbi:uncharacterized protein LOC129699275 [Leucoraja erinacea]|uniref:uncharacterized protein LOC129699275 n=1 Tax=Leucoraja erinaceus TaxID=7782 RepID=UPI002454C6CC|nr:uncharacterized protein LOC129699275 [Leucoraja erinacea]
MLKERIHTFHRKQPLTAWNSLQEFQHGQANSNWQSVTLSQLIAPHSTAVLVRVQLTARPDGYGFTVKWSGDHGLQIETAENTGLQPNDRLIEVNGICVLSALEDELESYLTTPTAQILALRNPAPQNPGSLNQGETDDVPKLD